MLRQLSREIRLGEDHQERSPLQLVDPIGIIEPNHQATKIGGQPRISGSGEVCLPLGAGDAAGQAQMHPANARLVGYPDIEPEGGPKLSAGGRLVTCGACEVAEAADAGRFARHGADLPIQRTRLLVQRPRRRVIRTPQRNVAQAPDAVRLALHLADLLQQRACLLIQPAGPRQIQAAQRDVAEPFDAVRSTEHRAAPTEQRQRALDGQLCLGELAAFQRDIAQVLHANGLAQDGPDLPIERRRLLIERLGLVVLAPLQRDVGDP